VAIAKTSFDDISTAISECSVPFDFDAALAGNVRPVIDEFGPEFFRIRDPLGEDQGAMFRA
jgi:hypothetical protein